MYYSQAIASEHRAAACLLSAAILVREIGCNKINRLELAMIFENIRLIW